MIKRPLGCFCDDFTGATDAASMIQKGGLNTLLLNGIPDNAYQAPEYIDAIVIAQKTRSIPSSEAVVESESAYNWLKGAGCEHVYYKYCSTFDSTDDGNIGPIIDRLLDKYDIQYTIICPSLPVNGRTVKQGVLYVNGEKLECTPMRHHPLNPMLHSEISVLMSVQGKHSCHTISGEYLRNGIMLRKTINTILESEAHFYLVPDYENEQDGELIAKYFAPLVFQTGASGLLKHLSEIYTEQYSRNPNHGKTTQESLNNRTTKSIILAGSCSDMTLRQIDHYHKSGNKIHPIDVKSLVSDYEAYMDHSKKLLDECGSSILIYSSSDKHVIDELRKSYGQDTISMYLERCMAGLAQYALDAQFTSVIVAGGETSGSVTKALGFSTYEIYGDIAPGVPILVPENAPFLSIVLKSGNFGDVDFFSKAQRLINERTTGHDKL